MNADACACLPITAAMRALWMAWRPCVGCCGVGVPGLEPGTSSLSGKRSNRLSYTPVGVPVKRTSLLYRIPQGASLRLPESHLDAADGLGDEVVDHRSDRGHRGDEHDVHRAEQRRIAKDNGGGVVVRDVRAARTLGAGDGRDRVLERV